MLDTRLVDVEFVDGLYLVTAPRMGVTETASGATFEEAIDGLRAIIAKRPR